VIGRRADGYHELVTLMQPLSLADELTVRPGGPGVVFECNHPFLPRKESNLVWRAARRFAQETGQEVRVRITLQKEIPVAAGLGGGSSDAAATLRALNLIFGEPLDEARLHHLAGELGADVPFFLLGTPAVARGIGDILSPLTLPPYWYLLLNPGKPLSTRWVYENLDLTRLKGAPQMEAWDPEHPENWVHNDLEAVAVKRYPQLRDLMEGLRELGAMAQAVSGSGPTVFGLFSTQEAARCAGQELRSTFNGWLALCRGLTGLPTDTAWENDVWMI
jgi:4-diphosphocytidyl-2-C-methyl-D-erythritol kinase